MSLGSIFGNIGNLFKTTEQLEQEKRQRKRQLERGIEKSVDALKEGQRQAEKDKEKFYQQAKQALSVGRRDEARRFMQFSRMQARNSENYTRQQLMWANALTQLRVAGSMQDAAKCFSSLAVECGLDPNLFENGLDSMSDVESTIGEMNKAMAKKWEKDSIKAGEEGDVEGDASIDDMLMQAEREVAAENGAGAPSFGASAPGHA